MDENKLGRQQALGARARELLESETLKLAFKELHDDYFHSWKNTRIGDTEARERLWWAISVIGLVEKHLKIWAERGKVATKDLAEIKYLKR